MDTLPLSSVQTVADHLRIQPDDGLIAALSSARELISSEVADNLADIAEPDKLPSSLHHCATLLAAELWAKAEAVEGVDESYTGMGARLMYDPVVRDLLRPWLKARIGIAQAPTMILPGITS